MSGITAEYTITLQNLLAAFEGESNAHAKYSAFAAKADEEGLQGVASLFRATARAEQIHLTNHAKVIGHLGARAECEIHPIKVKSTLENLKAALGGETYEIDTMYPGFLAEAAERSHTEAVRTFTWALEAERTHARLYTEAIVLLEAGNTDSASGSWLGDAKDFYVCPVCGYTSEDPEEHERCPVCKLPWEKFEVIQ
jgi:rubrerythrin